MYDVAVVQNTPTNVFSEMLFLFELLTVVNYIDTVEESIRNDAIYDIWVKMTVEFGVKHNTSIRNKCIHEE